MRRRVIALAGCFQAAALAKSIAFHGAADEDAVEASMSSVYALNPQSVEDVFGSLAGVRLGLSLLIEHFAAGKRDLDHFRCVMTLLQLAKKLYADSELSQRLRDGVEAAQVHAQDPGSRRQAELERLGALYLTTISTLSPRILVQGNPQYLQQARFVSWVRTMLLAGVRAGVLWHQLGGTRLQLLFRGRNITATASGLLRAIQD